MTMSLIACAISLSPEQARAGDDLALDLPDIIVRQSDLLDNDIRVSGGRTLLRLSNGTANAGTGPLYLYGVTPGNEDGTQDVRQRVFREDGSYFERVAGTFVYHSEHNHIHFEEWAQYRLRRVVGEDGVGDVVAAGQKTSFCILDLGVYDRSLPDYVSGGFFRTCSSTTQGLSVGWIDVYSKSLPGQNIDITDVSDGHYWLESEVDPNNNVLESNEDNNIARIRITIGDPSDINPDTYEPNGDLDNVRNISAGTPNSPNLGPCNPKRTLVNLTLHEAGDEDYFRFYSNETGGMADFVRVDFDNSDGNIDLELLDDNGTLIDESRTSRDYERISLFEKPEGWYYARVTGRNGDTSDNYRLSINPPANQPPAVETLTPAAGDVRIRHGLDLYMVNWAHTDPENDTAWVTVYLNETRELDETAEMIDPSLHTNASLGFVIINSAEVDPGTYYVYCQITDGGMTRGDWSDGTLTIVDLGAACVLAGNGNDCNENGFSDECDIEFGESADCNKNGIPDDCDIASGASLDIDGDLEPDECRDSRPLFHRGDINGDSSLDITDAVGTLDYLFAGGAIPSCIEASDFNNDRIVDISDAVASLNYLFSGGEPPAAPGPPEADCGNDTDAEGSPGDLGCDNYAGC
ncbi:MAG: lysyl oxidase family protein [Planctomycetota bacterium]|nr:lysyl oxidase family protein [Planctomycetota bacterium]